METIDRMEIEEPRVSPIPECLNYPHKSSYWACTGRAIDQKKWFWQKKKPEPDLWTVLHYSQEDAEANAAIPSDYWVWNGFPAVQASLSETMLEARRQGREGVVIKSFRNGEWITVQRYKSGEPLPEGLRE